MRIIEYKVLAEDDAGRLSRKVNTHIEEGWHIHGSPAVARSEYSMRIVQAMVRYDHTNNEGGMFEP